MKKAWKALNRVDNEELTTGPNHETDSTATAQPVSYAKIYLPLFAIAGVIVALDQWTKWWVRTNIPQDGSWQPQWLVELGWPARIVHWYNTGAAFGIFQDGNSVFIVMAFVVVIAILYFYPRLVSEDAATRWAVGLYLGGVVGNLIDRLMLGKVTDFISIGTFAVFNVADSSINVAVALLLLSFLLKERNEKRKASEPS
ncbi:MAG: signal peptidase II [Chloroflexota bacterium]